MRIMDRSSDVCSTDLVCRQAQRLVRTTQHHLKKAGRKSSLLEQLGDLEGNSGPFWRRLHDDGIARDQGRRHLLHQEIGRRFERRDSRDDSIRNALGNSIAAHTGRAAVEWHQLAGEFMDLPGAGAHESGAAEDLELCRFAWLSDRAHAQLHEQFLAVGAQVSRLFQPLRAHRPGLPAVAPVCSLGPLNVGRYGAVASALERSEEHTSELQSLMRISYAVFCLKKKKTT